MENSTGSENSKAAKKQPPQLTIQEAKELILSKMRNKQEKFIIPPSVLRNHGKVAPPITFRVPKFDLKRKRPSVMLYSQIDPSEKRETRSQRQRRAEKATTNGQLKESINTSNMITARVNSVKDKMKKNDNREY